MAIILVGEDVPSQIYVKNKIKTAKNFKIKSDLYTFPNDIQEQELINIIQNLNSDKNVHGIIVQLPLPKHINTTTIINTINPQKDIDGLTTFNYGNLILKNDIKNMLIPATPFGIYNLLKFYNIETTGKHCVIVGRGLTVGMPLSILLSKKIKHGDMTITSCNSSTINLKKHTKSADILISATGQPNLISKNMIKKNTIVIDVGISRIKDETKKSGTKIVGDVDFENVKKKASFITPVPGGVGPMTILGLLLNLIKAYNIQKN